MSRKDFVLIAETLRSTKPADEAGLVVWRQVVEAFAKALPAANPKFNADRFKRAAGL